MSTENGTGRDEEVVVDIKGFHGTPLVITFILCAIAVILGFILQLTFDIQDLGWIILITSMIYVAISFKTVQQEEIALIRLFGQGIYRVDAGLVFVPWGFMTLDRESRLDFQDVFPGPDDKIFYGDLEKEGATIPPGMLKPIRVLFGPPKEGDEVPDPKYAPYHKQMVVGVKFGVNWYIYDLLKFRNTIGNVEKARTQLQATAKGVFQSQFAKATPAIIAMRLETESGVLEKALDKVVKAWGANVISSPIEALDFSHSLNKSVTRTGEVEQEALQLGITTTAEASQTREMGKAKAEAKRNDVDVDIHKVKGELTARAEGMKAIKGLAGDEVGMKVLELETARAGLQGNPNMTIIAGSEGFASTAASLGKIFRGDENKAKEKK